MELVRDMKSPERDPVRRQLLGGPNVTIHSLNNKMKKYIHIPQCKDGASADTALRKYKVVEQIVETVGSGIKSPEGLDGGALWLGKRLTETNRDEFTTCSSRATSRR
jgi:Iap family predicted aminopeptidase